jgi:hypothetical protein
VPPNGRAELWVQLEEESVNLRTIDELNDVGTISEWAEISPQFVVLVAFGNHFNKRSLVETEPEATAPVIRSIDDDKTVLPQEVGEHPGGGL